jgi:magnesium-transporting ATPase (P-type)
MGHVLAVRSERDSFFKQDALSNEPLLGAVFLSFALQMATIYVPVLNPVFKTIPLTVGELFITIHEVSFPLTHHVQPSILNYNQIPEYSEKG